MSFFMIRLLQRYDHIELATDAQPPETLPPACWSTGKGRRSIEKVRPKIDLTLFVMVCTIRACHEEGTLIYNSKRAVYG
jgi:hypothetical protein